MIDNGHVGVARASASYSAAQRYNVVAASHPWRIFKPRTAHLSDERRARPIPSLTQTRQYGHGVVLAVPPSVWGAQHSRRNAHCVLSLDNLSYKAEAGRQHRECM